MIWKCSEWVVFGESGDDTQIQIWRDPWIPNVVGYMSGIPNPQYVHIEYVGDLILNRPKRLNDTLIRDFFYNDTAKAILQIPLA